MSHVLVLAPFDPPALVTLSRTGQVTVESWTETGRLYDPDELAHRINGEAVSHLVVEADFVFEETMAQTPGLRLIGLCRSTLHHVDVKAATERGILVVYSPARNALAVAELTVGMMINLARHISEAYRYVKFSQWDQPTAAYQRFRGTELAGKMAGIIGFGTIGRMVAARLIGMQMHLLVTDPYVSDEAVDEAGGERVALDVLLARADWVLVHAPSNPSTLGLVGRRQLELMKRTAFLVNTSAPGVCDEPALTDALKADGIAGAALDVYDGHPLPFSSPLLRLSNVLLTPHIGGATSETVERYSHMIASGILAEQAGRVPRHLANPAAWEVRARKTAPENPG